MFIINYQKLKKFYKYNIINSAIIDMYKLAADEFICDKIAKGEAEEADLNDFLTGNINEYVSRSLPQEAEVKIDAALNSLNEVYNYFLNNLMKVDFKNYKINKLQNIS